MSRQKNAPCLRFFALQHFRLQEPFFSPSLLREHVQKPLLLLLEASFRLGLATHFGRYGPSPSSLGSLFQLPTLWGFAFQSFSPLE